MPPKYPFARNHPANVASNDPSSSTTTPRRNQVDDRPIVVSASGIDQKSPGVGLTADSPSTLRSRIPSPRNPLAGFTNNSSSYPSPSTVLQQDKSRLLSLGKKKKNSENGRGWMRVDTESPTKDSTPLTGSRNGGPSSGGISIPRYDARGYPIKETDKGNGQSESGHSIAASSSSHTAGVDGESGRPPQRDRRPLPQAPDTGVNGLYGSYPPAQNGYSYSQPYSPYDPSPSGDYTPSIYAESAFSVASYISEGSMTHFKKYDALKENYSSYSISSKGGPRHLGEMFHLPADPTTWSYAGPEADDDFHDPDIVPGKKSRVWYNLLSVRGASNIGCLALLFIMLVMLFAGYPVITYYTSSRFRTNGGYNLGGINATGQIPNIGPFQLIDRDTPQEAYSFTSMETGETWDLIFSDEFNNDGRTFWDGDDPYWQAVDLHYWATNNLEWYDPRMITTKDGSLRITLTNMVTNKMNYTGGMMSTWNRFCFTGGYVEASVRLPGSSTVYGLWPAIWSMGNLGRAGYGGTLDGMWPYSYDSCDVGTLPNQTMNGLPEIATTSGPQQFDGSLSYLPGQRLSRCTCHSDTTHPGPKLDDGTFVGRAAPEIDMIEAVVNHDTLEGEVSLSGQWAPFNPNYYFINNSKTYEIYDTQNVIINSYQGGVYQQATSGLGVTDQNCYEYGTGCFSKYGYEYQPGRDDGYITWVSNAKKAWTVRSGAMGPNAEAGVGQRLVSEEPMYLIMNLGISENFGAVDYEGLMDLWPVHMDVDYIRVYQDPKKRNIGCDPADHPTAAYIEHFAEAYSNPNITTYEQVPNSVWPKNTLVDQC